MFRGSETRGRELRSMFFKRGASLEYITAGSTFRRTDAHVIETAEVLSVSTDTYGIPHVRFNISFQRPTRSVTHEGQRVLALKSFAERYSERCAIT
jgi:hypothetical protein